MTAVIVFSRMAFAYFSAPRPFSLTSVSGWFG